MQSPNSSIENMVPVKKIILLLCVLQSSICFSNDSLTVSIQPVFRDIPIQLNSVQYITDLNDTIKITQVRLYISNIEIINKEGSTYKESNSYHLIDLEKKGSLEVKLNTSIKNISQINFSVGVDSSASVSGAMSGDLDPTYGMYWAWNSGYINAKIEGTSNSCKTHKNKFEFHIGGYLSPHQTIQHIKLKVNAQLEVIKLNLDLNKWFTGINLAEKNSILTPGTKAVQMSKKYKQMFSIITE